LSYHGITVGLIDKPKIVGRMDDTANSHGLFIVRGWLWLLLYA